MGNSPYSIYCHNPRNPYYRLTCNRSDLMPVKTLEEQYDMDLDWNIRIFVSNQEHSEMLKAMFVEIVDFCEAFSGEHFFASNLADILKNFIDRELPFSLISPLLPEKALAKSDEMNTILARIWKPGKR